MRFIKKKETTKPDESINTIKKDLQYLLAQNEIVAIGVGKGTIYAAAK